MPETKGGEDGTSRRYLDLHHIEDEPKHTRKPLRQMTYYSRSAFIAATVYLTIVLLATGSTAAQPTVDSSNKPASAEDGGPRNWEVAVDSCRLNLRAEPSTSALILTGFEAGTILDNLGIREAEGRIWCDVQELGGGPRGYVAFDYLKPAVSPDGSVARGPDNSALRAGRGEFDATGTIPCASAVGQPTDQCEFGVARAGGGYATVVVTRPDGGSRIIFFRMGQPIGASSSEADPPGKFKSDKEADLHIIRVGDERYEIPDAVVLGG